MLASHSIPTHKGNDEIVQKLLHSGRMSMHHVNVALYVLFKLHEDGMKEPNAAVLKSLIAHKELHGDDNDSSAQVQATASRTDSKACTIQ